MVMLRGGGRNWNLGADTLLEKQFCKKLNFCEAEPATPDEAPEPWTLDPGPWTLDPGPWTLDPGP